MAGETRLRATGAPEHAQTDRNRGAFVHVLPRRRPGDSPATWVGQRVAYCFLKHSVVRSPHHGRHQAAVLAAALADSHASHPHAPDGRVPDVRTLTSWANLKKRVQHSIASSVEHVFAASFGGDLGLPSRGSRFLDALMSSPLDYSHLSTIAGSWSRHIASLNIAAQLDQHDGARLATAQRLLASTARAWSPSFDPDRSQHARFDIEVGRDVAVQYVPEAPWTVLQYMLALAARSDQLDNPMLRAFSLDLAAARWATSALLDGERGSWPGRWHVNEASDVVRNLLHVGIGGQGLRQAVTLAQRGYPWLNFKPSGDIGTNFVRVKRAYRRTLTEFGVRTGSLDETVLPADVSRMKVQMSRWVSIVSGGARSH
jgi:hypothetical protein